jgi:hypothetical protein
VQKITSEPGMETSSEIKIRGWKISNLKRENLNFGKINKTINFLK